MSYHKKTVLSLLSWAILLLIVVGLFHMAGHSRSENVRTGFLDQIKGGYDNLVVSLFFSRKPPLSTVELEENLKLHLPDPFVRFDRAEWAWFWNTMYGRFAEESNTNWPKRTSQLSREEVQRELIYNYPQPFNGFGEKQWAIFWQTILKGKVFR